MQFQGVALLSKVLLILRCKLVLQGYLPANIVIKISIQLLVKYVWNINDRNELWWIHEQYHCFGELKIDFKFLECLTRRALQIARMRGFQWKTICTSYSYRKDEELMKQWWKKSKVSSTKAWFLRWAPFFFKREFLLLSQRYLLLGKSLYRMLDVY